ncbi:MAG: TolC family protein [Burkholderiales bacterium]|nr:TolC family protein [Burkholderiales bacterium]
MSSRVFRAVLLAVLATAGAVQAQAPIGLGGLTLKEAEQLMQAHNRELIAARRQLEVAQAGTLSAGAVPNPQFSYSMTNINPSQGIGAGNLSQKQVDSVFRVDQLVERGDKRELRLATAKRLEAATGEDLAEALRQQRLALAAAYYDLLFAQEKTQVTRDTATLFERTLEAADRRLKAGDIAAADVARIRVDVMRALNDTRVAEADQAKAQLALGYLIGAESEAKRIRAIDPWPTVGAVPPGGVTEEMVDRRPDVRGAATRVQAAQSARELARALKTRDVTVGIQYEHYPTNPSNSLGSGNSYGFAVSVPLFFNYQFQGEIARAEADFAAANDTLAQVRAKAYAELAGAAADLAAAADRLKRYEGQLLVEAQKSADYAEFAYRNGAIGVMDLLDARRTLRAVQVDAAAARDDYAKALAAWRAGLGEAD